MHSDFLHYDFFIMIKKTVKKTAPWDGFRKSHAKIKPDCCERQQSGSVTITRFSPGFLLYSFSIISVPDSRYTHTCPHFLFGSQPFSVRISALFRPVTQPLLVPVIPDPQADIDAYHYGVDNIENKRQIIIMGYDLGSDSAEIPNKDKAAEKNAFSAGGPASIHAPD